ncbi:MAG TPA: hypothetical protein VLV83_26175 [Acidobacteriota bacterium]|nr:hypothetical protein [Acidobacteriota bacterium]
MKTKVVGLIFGVVFAGYVVYTSMGLDQVTVEACVEYNGSSACRTASGVSEEEATKTAVDVACAMLAQGRDESMACNETEPTSVQRLD